MSLSTLKGMNDAMDALSVEPAMIRDGRTQWPGGPAIAQNFSLPSSIIYYIAMNPTNPKVYNKLIQTCKYFFERNPILVAAIMTEKDICSNDKCCRFDDCCVKMDIKKIQSKIWLTRNLFLHQNNIPNFTALLRPKIYRCDIVNLSIGRRTVDFEDFKLFALFAKDIRLGGTKIVYNNESPVMLENILETLSDVAIFKWDFENNASIVPASTLKNMSKLKNLGNLKKFYLFNVPEDFKLDDLFNFIKDHNGLRIGLHFFKNISEQYKNKLDRLIDSLIESKLSNGFIFYFDQNEGKLEILRKRFFK